MPLSALQVSLTVSLHEVTDAKTCKTTSMDDFEGIEFWFLVMWLFATAREQFIFSEKRQRHNRLLNKYIKYYSPNYFMNVVPLL